MMWNKVKRTVGAAAGVAVALLKRYNLSYHDQSSLFSEIQRKQGYLLVILDACRYDYFDMMADDFFDCDYKPVWSTGRNTFEYVRKTWTDRYPELTYLSAAPPVNSDSREQLSRAALERFNGYVTQEHIGDIRELFQHESVNQVGTCPPEVVTEKAMDVQADKMVVHYFQPHAPYIGDEEIIRRDKSGQSNTKLIWDNVRDGKLSMEKVRRGYESNLKRVLNSVAELIDNVDYDNVIITSDHGEALGEFTVLSHPNKIPYHPKTRIVPWAEIQGVKSYETPSDTPKQIKSRKSVEERLSQLGYV